jgi:hypothetical protein
MEVGGERLLAWYAAGDTEYRLPGTDMVFKVSAPTAEFLRYVNSLTCNATGSYQRADTPYSRAFLDRFLT